MSSDALLFRFAFQKLPPQAATSPPRQEKAAAGMAMPRCGGGAGGVGSAEGGGFPTVKGPVGAGICDSVGQVGDDLPRTELLPHF